MSYKGIATLRDQTENEQYDGFLPPRRVVVVPNALDAKRQLKGGHDSRYKCYDGDDDDEGAKEEVGGGRGRRSDGALGETWSGDVHVDVHVVDDDVGGEHGGRSGDGQV